MWNKLTCRVLLKGRGDENVKCQEKGQRNKQRNSGQAVCLVGATLGAKEWQTETGRVSHLWWRTKSGPGK